MARVKKVTKEMAVSPTKQTYGFIATGIFRHAIHGAVEKRRAFMRAALRVYGSTGVQAQSKKRVGFLSQETTGPLQSLAVRLGSCFLPFFLLVIPAKAGGALQQRSWSSSDFVFAIAWLASCRL